MKPLDPRLLVTAKSVRWFIVGIVAISIGNMALIVCFAWQLSSFITQVFIEHVGVAAAMPALIGAGMAGLGRAATLWLQEWLGAVSATRAKAELRAKLLDSVTTLGGDWVAERGSASIHSLITQQLDALDAYFAKFLPQLIYTAIVTPVFTVLIFAFDVASGWSLALTLPLIPLFMVLIGWATQSVQSRQLESLGRLTTHFVEALRGLTTLKVFGRAENQVTAIAKSSEQYRVRTMKVLRVSFLSGFALELIASLSVALIAVSIGLRLVNGSIGLGVGLFILLLAPEAYLPLRMVGANFHVSAEGVAASKAVLDVIDEARGGSRVGSAAAGVDELEAKPGQLIVVHGPSGAGKSTRLNALRRRLEIAQVAWLPQNVGLLEGSVLENIVGPGGNINQIALTEAVGMAALDDLAFEHQVGQDASRVSGGQAQRIGLARAIYAALNDGRKTVLLDEPVSAQDQARAAAISSSLVTLAQRGFAIVAVSHQPIEGANQTIEVRHG